MVRRRLRGLLLERVQHIDPFRKPRDVKHAVCPVGPDPQFDDPSDSAVRTLLSRLAAKGLIAHRTVNQAYVYAPVEQTEAVAETALQRLVQTFFQGSAAQAATALLGMEPRLEPGEIEMLQRAIDMARKETK